VDGREWKKTGRGPVKPSFGFIGVFMKNKIKPKAVRYILDLHKINL